MHKITIATVAAAGLFAASAANAASVTQTTPLKASADKAWATASPDFCGIGTFHPAVEKCELSDGGKTRTLSLKGGGTIVEKQTAWSDKKHSYSYEIVSSPLPVENYKSTFKINANGKDVSSVTWSSTFKAKGASDADAKKAIAGIYSSGIEALQQKL